MFLLKQEEANTQTCVLALMDTEQSVCLQASRDTRCRTECFLLNERCWQMLIPAQRLHCGVTLQQRWPPRLRCWIPGAPLRIWRLGGAAAWLEMRPAWGWSDSLLRPWTRMRRGDLNSCWRCCRPQQCGSVTVSWAGSGTN